MQVVTIDAVEDVPGANETALQQAVTMHPVGIGLCVGDWIKEWRAYTGGILKVPSKLCLIHCRNGCNTPELALQSSNSMKGHMQAEAA